MTSCPSSFSVGGELWDPQHSHSLPAYPYLVCTLSKMSCFSYYLWAKQRTWVENGRTVVCLSALDMGGRKAPLRAHSYSCYSKLWFCLGWLSKMLWTVSQKVQELVFSLLLLKLSLTSNAKHWESPSTFHTLPFQTSPRHSTGNLAPLLPLQTSPLRKSFKHQRCLKPWWQSILDLVHEPTMWFYPICFPEITWKCLGH